MSKSNSNIREKKNQNQIFSFKFFFLNTEYLYIKKERKHTKEGTKIHESKVNEGHTDENKDKSKEHQRESITQSYLS